MKVEIRKINDTLKDGIKNQKDVFYFLVNCRKCLEELNKNTGVHESYEIYPMMKLFSDWLVHPNLYGTGAKKLLKKYEEHFQNSADHGVFSFMTDEFILFRELRRDLKMFCKQFNLEEDFLEDKKWIKFISLLFIELKDVPLKNAESVPKTIFVFSEGFSVGKKRTVSFALTLSDGRHISCDIDLEILA